VKAAEFSAVLPDLDATALSRLCGKLSEEDYRSLLIQRFEASRQPTTMDSVLAGNFIQGLAESNPQHALSTAMEMPASVRGASVSAFFNFYVDRDPSWVTQQLDRLPAGIDRDTALASLYRRSMKKGDSTSAQKYLSEISDPARKVSLAKESGKK